MRLKELRLDKNLSQSEVAKAINTSQRNIGRWENGENEPGASFVKLLAEFFECSTDYLLELEDDFGISTAKKNAPQLNAEEQQLLNDYRALSAPGKQLIKTTLKTLLPSSEAAQRKNKKLQ